jgi:hypothetical protein
MPDNLRDRIANTLYQELSVELPAAIRGADAVIAALDLNTPVEYLSVDGTRRNFMVAGHYTVEENNA